MMKSILFRFRWDNFASDNNNMKAIKEKNKKKPVPKHPEKRRIEEQSYSDTSGMALDDDSEIELSLKREEKISLLTEDDEEDFFNEE